MQFSRTLAKAVLVMTGIATGLGAQEHTRRTSMEVRGVLPLVSHDSRLDAQIGIGVGMGWSVGRAMQIFIGADLLKSPGGRACTRLPCDTRHLLGVGSATLRRFLLDAQGRLAPFAGIGAYGSLWGGGRRSPDSDFASGVGPAGLILEGGLSWRPVAASTVAVRTDVAYLFRLAGNDDTIVRLGAGFAF